MQVDEFIRPPEENVQKVMDWLKSEGDVLIRQRSVLWIEVTCRVTVAERLLDTSFYYFTHEHRRHGASENI